MPAALSVVGQPHMLERPFIVTSILFLPYIATFMYFVLTLKYFNISLYISFSFFMSQKSLTYLHIKNVLLPFVLPFYNFYTL